MSKELTDGLTEPKVEEGGAPNAETPAAENYLSKFVGEGLPYQTIEEAAEGLAKKAVNADQHIETVLSEKKALEAQLLEESTRNKSVEDILTALKEEKVVTPALVPESPSQSVSDPLTIDSVLQALEEKTKGENEAAKKTAAVSSAWDTLSTDLGSMDAAKAAVAKYIEGDAAKKALVDSLAVTDPQALLTIVKPLHNPTEFTTAHKGIHIEGVPTGGKLTWDIVRKVQKEDPKLANSPAFRRKMQADLL